MRAGAVRERVLARASHVRVHVAHEARVDARVVEHFLEGDALRLAVTLVGGIRVVPAVRAREGGRGSVAVSTALRTCCKWGGTKERRTTARAC